MLLSSNSTTGNNIQSQFQWMTSAVSAGKLFAPISANTLPYTGGTMYMVIDTSSVSNALKPIRTFCVLFITPTV